MGGGIGGLAAALALRQAGIPVTVLEARPSLQESGAGLSLWPNAMHALRALGLADEVQARGAMMDSHLIQRSDGKVLGRARLDLHRRHGAPGIGIRRSDLMGALRSRLDPAEVWTGTTVTRLEHTERGAAAMLAGGGRVEGTFLVGADGLHSVVRRSLINDAPRYLGAVAWRGLASLGVKSGGLALGPGAHAGWVPVGPDHTYWFCCRNAEVGRRIGDLRSEVLELFGRWWDPIPSLIQATAGREILRHELYDRPPTRRWGAGSITLLGDAAHPMSPGAGQGACMALEDAVVLADCIARMPEATGALRLYEAQRIPRTSRMQGTSLMALRALQPRGWAGHLARDLVVRLPSRWLAGRQSWMFNFRP